MILYYVQEAANTAIVNKLSVPVIPVCKKTIRREVEDEASTGMFKQKLLISVSEQALLISK